ncbi:hypothetical protein BGS_1260 [Beggiatoa sp. SS]|nr:hypothetical protein BGS_1260 [Beggiatoa sp. SS]
MPPTDYPTPNINLHELISQIITEQMPQALEKSIDLGLENRSTSQEIQGQSRCPVFHAA